jgi:hypothetical protein
MELINKEEPICTPRMQEISRVWKGQWHFWQGFWRFLHDSGRQDELHSNDSMLRNKASEREEFFGPAGRSCVAKVTAFWLNS